jgi:hypothetical protein
VSFLLRFVFETGLLEPFLASVSFYYVMDAYYADLVTSIVVPTLLVALLAAAVAIMFFEVFGMGTAVLLQCFIAGAPLSLPWAGVGAVRVFFVAHARRGASAQTRNSSKTSPRTASPRETSKST